MGVTSPTSPLGRRRRPRRRRRWGAVVVPRARAGAVGVILFQGLANATLYFCNADEVGVKSELHGRQAVPAAGHGRTARRVAATAGSFASPLTFNGATVPVALPGRRAQRPVPGPAGPPWWRAGWRTAPSRRPHPREARQRLQGREPRPRPRHRAVTERPPRDRSPPVNGALGMAGIALGLAASLLGVRSRSCSPRCSTGRGWCAVGVALRLARAGRRRARRRGDGARPHHAGLLAGLRRRGGLDPHTPPLYNVASLWSSLDGSILLWTLILALYVVATRLWFRARLTDPLVTWALVMLLVIAAFFFLLLVGPANPFSRGERRRAARRPRAQPAPAEPPAHGRCTHRCSTSATSGSASRSRSPSARSSPGRVGEGWLLDDPALDALRLGVPVRRHRARRLVELRGAGLGWRAGAGTRWRTPASCRG